MKLLVKTLMFVFLLPLASIDLQAQGTKYSIDNGPIKAPLRRRIARWRVAQDKKATERFKSKQKQREEKGRKQMIKRHLSHQPLEDRKRLQKEMEAKPINYPEKVSKRKARKKK